MASVPLGGLGRISRPDGGYHQRGHTLRAQRIEAQEGGGEKALRYYRQPRILQVGSMMETLLEIKILAAVCWAVALLACLYASHLEERIVVHRRDYRRLKERLHELFVEDIARD